MFYQRVIRFILVILLSGAGFAAIGQSNDLEARLRAALSADPQNDAIRERLSVLHLQTGRPDGALYHARYLSNRAASPALRAQARALVERLEGRTWGWRPIFSVVPSSNLNKGASGDTIYIGDRPFTIDEDSRAKDGVGLTFGAAVWKNWRPNEIWRGTISGEASATLYPDSDLEEKQNLSTTLAFDRRLGDHSLGLGLTLDAQTERGDVERWRATPFVSGTYAVNPHRQLTARFDWSDVHFPQERFRSGPTTRLTLGWRETLSPRMRLNFSLPLATERTGRAHLDNNSAGVSARLETLWADGDFKTTFGLAHSVDSYLGAFPGTSVKRKDRVTTLSLEMSNAKIDIKGFVPTLRLEYTRSHSNVSLFDYDSHDFLVTFQRKF